MRTMFVLGLSVFAALASMLAHSVKADTFTVTVTTDGTDALPGNGVCETVASSGVCSLRAAIMEANALVGEDTVVLPADTMVLTRVGADDTTTNGDLDVTGRLTIRGVQSDTSIVDGNGLVTSDRVFDIRPSAVVTIVSVGVHNGQTADSGAGLRVTSGATLIGVDCAIRDNRSLSFDGGGVWNDGKLVLQGCAINGNRATYYGGGIASLSPETHIIGSKLYGNVAYGLGGAVYSTSMFTVTESVVEGNVSTSGGGIYGAASAFVIVKASAVVSNTASDVGGGLYLHVGQISDSHVVGNDSSNNGGGMTIGFGCVSCPNLSLLRTTVARNVAANGGGGIYATSWDRVDVDSSAIISNTASWGGGIFRDSGGVNVVNSTISGNSVTDGGGGIDIGINAGHHDCNDDVCGVQLFNTTIVHNLADSDGVAGGAGGGVSIRAGTHFTVANSIIANNLAFGVDDDCNGALYSLNHNLIETTTNCTITGLTARNIYGEDPALHSLALNGGTTLNHLPKLRSPALDKGNSAGCADPSGATLTTDQRGMLRPKNGRCDIGAVEGNDTPRAFVPSSRRDATASW